jgi:GT2 family glycosyltransferase
MMKILVGLTVWNHWQIAERCLKSFKEHTDLSDVRFMIFDNGSDDEETRKWLDGCGEEVYHIGENTGCCGGWRNIFDFSFKYDAIEFVSLLNVDVLFTDGWLLRLVDVMRLDEKIIVVAPKDNNGFHCWQMFLIPEEFRPKTMFLSSEFNVRVFGNDLKLQEYIKREFYEKRKHPAFVECGSVDMPVSLWRKSLVRDVGNFDREYDYSLGDIEMFIRIKKKGYKIIYCLSSFIYHYSYGGAGRYEGFSEKFGKSLNKWCEEKASLIKHIYGIDISDYGKSTMAESLFEREQFIVKL